METKKLNIEDFKSNTLSKKEQKTVHGGDEPNIPEDIITGIAGDTIRGNGKGSN
ncbi:rSAM-modified peptide [Flavobacterium collinsii]|uniref:Bacteriocin-type signal sequence n=1 Tax=Flavobacterium collinsii TaxID=1114861 RepID=A0ABN7EIG6_9FLAO|nr:rSAM-modified peptide [Flavobacterium collinsii]CAA9196867.1 hypothetical protein FLACOL7796_01355 [Flavobacterium collinsii]